MPAVGMSRTRYALATPAASTATPTSSATTSAASVVVVVVALTISGALVLLVDLHLLISESLLNVHVAPDFHHCRAIEVPGRSIVSISPGLWMCRKEELFLLCCRKVRNLFTGYYIDVSQQSCDASIMLQFSVIHWLAEFAIIEGPEYSSLWIRVRSKKSDECRDS